MLVLTNLNLMKGWSNIVCGFFIITSIKVMLWQNLYLCLSNLVDFFKFLSVQYYSNILFLCLIKDKKKTKK
jgi:hypothetical protein